MRVHPYFSAPAQLREESNLRIMSYAQKKSSIFLQKLIKKKVLAYLYQDKEWEWALVRFSFSVRELSANLSIKISSHSLRIDISAKRNIPQTKIQLLRRSFKCFWAAFSCESWTWLWVAHSCRFKANFNHLRFERKTVVVLVLVFENCRNLEFYSNN